jgi:hypothetical protein
MCNKADVSRVEAVDGILEFHLLCVIVDLDPTDHSHIGIVTQ